MSGGTSTANAANLAVSLAFEDPDCLGVADWAAVEHAVERMGLTAQPIPTLIDPGTTTGAGFKKRPILGPVAMAFTLDVTGDPRWFDRFARAMTRNGLVSETILDAGPPAVSTRVYRYDPTGKEQAFTGRFGMQDIDDPLVWTMHGMHVGGLTINAAANAFTLAQVTGEAMGYSFYAPYPVADVANVGTYVGPQMRGQPSPAYEDHVVYVKIIDPGDPNTAMPSVGLDYTPLQFKVETIAGGGLPTFAGITYYQTYEEQTDGSLLATWRDIHDQDGYDVGTVDKGGTKAPVQIQFAGTLADTALAVAVDDVWSMSPIDIPPLVVTYPGEGQGFTLAHMSITVTDPETGDTWQLDRDSFTLTYGHPIVVAHGGPHPFVTQVRRSDEQMISFAIEQGVSTPEWVRSAMNQKKFDVTLDAGGAQFPGIPSVTENEPAPRRGYKVKLFESAITQAQMSIAGSAPITNALAFQSSAAGFDLEVTDYLD